MRPSSRRCRVGATELIKSQETGFLQSKKDFNPHLGGRGMRPSGCLPHQGAGGPPHFKEVSGTLILKNRPRELFTQTVQTGPLSLCRSGRSPAAAPVRKDTRRPCSARLAGKIPVPEQQKPSAQRLRFFAGNGRVVVQGRVQPVFHRAQFRH